MESTHGSRWYLVGLLTVIAALNYADRSAMSAVLSLIRDDLQLSPVMLGAVGSAFLWVYAICSPASGYFADRWPRSRVVVWSLVAWSAVTLLTGLARTSTELLIARCLLGIAECAYVPAAIGLTAEYHPGSTRARAIGIQLAGYNAGVILGGVFAGYAGDHWGWRPAFWVLGVAGLLMAVVTHFTIPPDKATATQNERPIPLAPMEVLRTLFGIPTFIIILLESTCMAAGAWIFLVWLPLYFKETFHLSLTAAGIAGTVGLQTAAITASLAGGYLSDRFAGARRERRMLFQFICFVGAIPFITVFFGTPSFESASLAILMFTLVRTLGSANDNVIICDVLPSRVWSSAVGVTNFSNCLSGGLAVMLTGYLQKDYGLGSVFSLLCFTSGAAAILVWIGYRYYLKNDLAREQERQNELALHGG